MLWHSVLVATEFRTSATNINHAYIAIINYGQPYRYACFEAHNCLSFPSYAPFFAEFSHDFMFIHAFYTFQITRIKGKNSHSELHFGATIVLWGSVLLGYTRSNTARMWSGSRWVNFSTCMHSAFVDLHLTPTATTTPELTHTKVQQHLIFITLQLLAVQSRSPNVWLHWKHCKPFHFSVQLAYAKSQDSIQNAIISVIFFSIIRVMWSA